MHLHLPPIIATLLTLTFIVYLFRRDFNQEPNVTGALWIPFFWVVISGSRFVSQWLHIFGFNVGGSSVEEGSPLDALIFLAMIAGGMSRPGQETRPLVRVHAGKSVDYHLPRLLPVGYSMVGLSLGCVQTLDQIIRSARNGSYSVNRTAPYGGSENTDEKVRLHIDSDLGVIYQVLSWARSDFFPVDRRSIQYWNHDQ